MVRISVFFVNFTDMGKEAEHNTNYAQIPENTYKKLKNPSIFF